MIQNVDSAEILKERSEPKRSTIFNKIVHFLDLKLLKDAIYVNIVFGFSFAMFSENMFNALLPIFLIEKGFHQVWSSLFFECIFSRSMIDLFVFGTVGCSINCCYCA